MTESAYFASLSQRDCFNALGVERYQIVATLDERTSATCQELDGQVFSMKDYVPGSTAPPFHPWCRTVTCPYFTDMEGLGERAARDPETGKTYYVPSDMTYKEWKKSFAEGGGKSSQTPALPLAVKQSDNQPKKPASMIGDYRDFSPLSLSKAEKASLLDLRDRAAQTHCEHAQILVDDVPGDVVTSGLYGTVRIPTESIPDKGHVTVFHSHTNDTPLSAQDFSFLTNERIDKVGCIAHNGDVFIASIGDGWRPTRNEYLEDLTGLRDLANENITSAPDFESWELSERNYAAVREQAYLTARRYQWTLEGGRIDE